MAFLNEFPISGMSLDKLFNCARPKRESRAVKSRMNKRGVNGAPVPFPCPRHSFSGRVSDSVFIREVMIRPVIRTFRPDVALSLPAFKEISTALSGMPGLEG